MAIAMCAFPAQDTADSLMSLQIYLISAILVFVFSGLLAMAGLGAAFLFVPLFYYLGVPLEQATSTALLLNCSQPAFCHNKLLA